MPDLRRDPIVGRWVIISTERNARPKDFIPVQAARPLAAALCPFCPGQERLTPKEIMAYRPQPLEPNSPNWTVRVVPNKFPALQVEGDLDRQGLGLYDRMNGIGAHEVIIETPNHADSLADMPAKRIEDVLWAYRDRMIDLKKDVRFRYILIFKNHGASAGATLEHSHSQLIALPIIPTSVHEEIEGCRTHYEQKERCIYCDIIRRECELGHRLVLESEFFLALCPYAPRFGYETWIVPKNHAPRFERERDIAAFAETLRAVIVKLNGVTDNAPFNYGIHSASAEESAEEHCHWHMEILPQMTRAAGFEWGTGAHMNSMAPEDAARLLRNVPV